MAGVFQEFSTQFARLSQLISSRMRATPEQVANYIEPRPGINAGVSAQQHTYIFGRRGSGKTSIILKAAHDLSAAGHPTAIVDCESLRNPDKHATLLYILLHSMEGFYGWLINAPAEHYGGTSFFDFIVGRRLGGATQAHKDLALAISELRMVLRLPPSTLDLQLRQDADIAPLERAFAAADRKLEGYIDNRLDYLGAALTSVVRAIRKDAFLFVDDLYRLPRVQQPFILDRIHKIVKNKGIWLKIGTVRNRTTLAVPDEKEGRIGLLIGEDVSQADLDASLEHFTTTSKYLTGIFDQLLAEVKLERGPIATEPATDRLMLCSGGVVRDFLNLLNSSVQKGTTRTEAAHFVGSSRLTAADVYEAVIEYSDQRLREFGAELGNEEQGRLSKKIEALVDFCVPQKTNLFLAPTNLGGNPEPDVLSLMDLKAIHHVRSNIQMGGKRYNAYMLDLSLTAPDRERKSIKLPDLTPADLQANLTKNLIIPEPLIRKK
jgi:hypothetical protein